MSDDPISSGRGASEDGGGSRDGHGFLVQVGAAAPLACREVRGFHEAAVAAVDPAAALPRQLVLVGLDEAGRAWVAAWAEDSERVRRSLALRRLLDDREILVVATLTSYGHGVETALAVESITEAGAEGPASIFRSGVHSKEAVDAMLEVVAAAPQEGDEPSWFAHV